MAKLQINIFTQKSDRFPFTWLAFNELLQCKYIDEIIIEVHGEQHNYDQWTEKIKSEGLRLKNVQFAIYPNAEYLPKVHQAFRTECEYSCKMDDDVLISRYVWDYIFENLGSLHSHSLMTPCFSNGVPSVDFFLEDFLTEDGIKIANNIFLKDSIPSYLWGVSFETPKKFIESSNEWDYEKYWEVFRQHMHWTPDCMPFGMHPARFSYEFHEFIWGKIKEEPNKVFDKQTYSLMPYNSVYTCNNLFVSRTEFWKESQKVAHDGWDEGQLTVYAFQLNQTPLFIRNSNGIHMAYGCTPNQIEIENKFISWLCGKF